MKSYQLKAADEAFTMCASARNGKNWAEDFIPVVARGGSQVKFCIVTPCLNAVRYIDETIFSVLSQAGAFEIRYHVQDGGSTDGTLEKLERWTRLLQTGLPSCCQRVEFTYGSEKDDGLYDAVSRGFGVCGEAGVLSWINADDRYQPAAFATVAGIMQQFPNVRWLTGSSSILTESGIDKGYMGRRLYPRKAIRAGVYDERRFPPTFIQQEGTFWTQELWNKTNGLNRRLRLAGDYDLWRRFASFSEIIVADRVLGCFRSREGRLSQNINAYYAEIDGLLSADETKLRDITSKEFETCKTEHELMAKGFNTPIASYDRRKEAWQMIRTAGTRYNAI
jgi:glycosyltransferase involved in cell wall biosynthesis